MLEFLSLPEVANRTALDEEVIRQYLRTYEPFFDCVRSGDFKELFFTQEDVDLLKQVHDMVEILGMAKPQVEQALTHLMTPKEYRQALDFGEKETRELINQAIKKFDVPQIPTEKKLINVIRVQKKMAELFREKWGSIENLERQLKEAVEKLPQQDHRFLDKGEFQNQMRVRSEIVGEMGSTIASLSRQIQKLSGEFINLKFKNGELRGVVDKLNHRVEELTRELESRPNPPPLAETHHLAPSPLASSTFPGIPEGSALPRNDIETTIKATHQTLPPTPMAVSTEGTALHFSDQQLAKLKAWADKLHRKK